MLAVEHFGGTEEVRDSLALDRILARRFGADVNAFWITGEEPFPALAILVRGELASVHFFPHDGHAGFQSRGTAPSQHPVTFCCGSPTELIQVPSESVVAFDDARLAAHEVLSSFAMPQSLRWFEL